MSCKFSNNKTGFRVLSLAVAIATLSHTAAAQQLEEVVVTAQFKSQDLQSVPIAITALDSEAMELRSMTNALAINEAVPNINVAKSTGVASGMKVFLRGIGEDESRIGSDPAIGIYVDDVYIGRQTGALIDLADVAQMEVLRGPQGTLYGRNSNGGAIRIASKQPELEDYVSLKATAGSDELAEGYVLGNAALTDTLAGQISVMSKSQRGFIKNTDTGEYLGDVDKTGARVALKYYGENWEVLWSADYLKDKSEPGYASKIVGDDGNLFTVNQSQFPLSSLINGQTKLGDFVNDLEQAGTMLKISGNIGDMTLTSITAYRELDNDLLTIISAPYYQHLKQDQISQEFRLNGSGEGYDWVTGLYLYRESGDQYSEFYFGNSSIDLLTESAAVYGQLTYDLTDRLHLTGGLRYTWESKEFDPDASPDYWSAAGRANTDKKDETWGQFSWKGVAAYDFTDDVMGYFSVTTGFKSGGWSSDSFDPVDEESVVTYELGVKSKLSEAVRLNVTAYYNDYSDLQVNGTSPITNAFTRVNAGDVVTYGVEADLDWQITESLRLGAFVGTLEGEYKSVAPQAALLITKDSELKQAPKLSYGVNLTHRTFVGEGELVSNLQYAFTDKQYNDLANTEVIARDDTDIVNARIAYNWGVDTEYSVALWGKNLLDEEYAAAATTGNLAVYPGDPRTWGVDFSVKF